MTINNASLQATVEELRARLAQHEAATVIALDKLLKTVMRLQVDLAEANHRIDNRVWASQSEDYPAGYDEEEGEAV